MSINIVDGWFEEKEDGTLDYMAVLDNGDIIRCVNTYLVGVKFEGFEYSISDTMTFEGTIRYDQY